MRNWAAVFGIVGGGISTAFWSLVPVISSNTYVQGVSPAFYAVFIILSLGGLVGGLLAGVSNRVSPALMAVAVIPGTGALFLPGLLLAVATLLAIRPLSEQPKLTV